MIGLFCFVLAVLASPFKSKSRLEAENAVLRHQLIVLRRKLKGRARLTNSDRWFFVQMYRCFPSIWGGRPFCEHTRPALAPWVCLWAPPSASDCCMALSSCGFIAEISYRSTSQPTRQRRGLHARSPGLSLGLGLRAFGSVV